MIFFLLLGAVSAVDADNVSIKEDSNLDDGVSTLSSQNKLGISDEDSISETNIVNSQNDNLENSSSTLSTINSEEDNGDLNASSNEATNINTATLKSSDNNVLATKNTDKVPVDIAVVSATSNNANSVFKLKLTDSENGKVLAGRTVNLILDGKNLAGKTDENGIAQITAKPLVKGTYSVTLKFAGTVSRYAATTLNKKVAVDGFVPVNMTVVSAISNNVNSIFNVRLTDSENGKVLSGRTVNLVVNGKNLAGKTDENGIAKITAGPLAKGTHSVTLKFAGTVSHYAPTTVNQKVAVEGFVPVKMTVDSAVSNNANTVFKVKLTDSENGKVLAGRTVNLILNGKNLAGKTDENGIAKITTGPLLKGTYSVTLKFSGTVSRYAATTLNKKVAVDGFVPVKMTVVSADSDNSAAVFKVKLTDSENGKALSGRTVNLVVNGKNLAGKTDGNGIAKITTKPILKGTYSVTLKFSGTASHYAPTTITKKVFVNGFVPVKMTVVKAESNMDNSVFEVKLTDSENGKVLSGRTINLVLDGKNIAAKTDKNGIAKITTKHLSTGSYTVTLKFAGTASHYAPTTVTQKVYIVTDKAKSVWINADSGSDAMKNAIAKLLRQKGWTVYVSGTGPGYHYPEYFEVTSDYKYYITLYNGFCAGTVREAYSDYIQNTLKSKGVQLVIMWETGDWTNPDGMKPYRYGDFTGYNAARAWDDNFSNSDPSINNVAAWLKSKNAFYCASPTAEGLVEQFLAGGYFAYSGK